jgi:hypothetical protein
VTLRSDLRGVSLVDLGCAALMVPIAIWAGSVAVSQQEAQQTQVQETQVQDAGDAYHKTWDWCKGRFPYRTDLQEACQWGAYEMLPGEDVPTEEAHDA